MSLSNLESQLASINSRSGLPSSKKHDESVGRGIHHSVQHGHAILHPNAKHKPSVLHPDSRSAAAADIPFSTLHQNSIISLKFLFKETSILFDIDAKKLPWGTLLGPKSVNFERGLNTPETNKKIDTLIKDAVFLLSSCWGDATVSTYEHSLSSIPLDANVSSSVLHIMEYLVQKYYVHVHNSETLLISFLPHHETFLFERILQLVDLSQFPQWSFLRPYSATVGVRRVPRTLIAKWAASTVDNGGGIVLINALCDIARRAAKIHSQEKVYFFPKQSTMEIRRGISLMISFAAATLVESLQIQNSTCGTIIEPTVRCLLPYILGAVEPHENWKKKSNIEDSSSLSPGAICTEWRSFGYILISILMKNCELSTDVCEILATGIVKGSIEVESMFRCQDQFENLSSGKTVSSLKGMESASESLLALMSILSRCKLERCADKKSESSQSSLSLALSPDGKMDCSFGSVKGTLGSGLPLSTFYMLANLDILPTALGYLSESRHVDVRTLLASLIILCISVVCNGSSKKKKIDCELIMKLAIRLIEESSLRSAWLEKDYSLATSTSVFFVKAFMYCCCFDAATTSAKRFAKLLRCVREIDPIGCDSGVGYVINTISSSTDPGLQTTVENIQKLLKLSGHLQVNMRAIQSDSPGNFSVVLGNSDSLQDGKITALDHMLPSRVALKNSKKDIRIGAIEKLIQEIDAMGQKERDEVANELFHRYVTDESASVAAAAANGVISLFSSGVLSKDFLSQSIVVKDSVAGIKKWSVARQLFRNNKKLQSNEDEGGDSTEQENPFCKLSLSKNEVSSVCSAIRISGLVAKKMSEQLLRDYQSDSLTDKEWSDVIPESMYLIVQELVLHVGIGILTDHEGENVSDKIKETALTSLLAAVSEDEKNNEIGNGMQMIWNKNSLFLGIVSRCTSNISRSTSNSLTEHKTLEEESIARKTFLQIFLSISAKENNNDLDDKSASIQCSAALGILADFRKSTPLTGYFLGNNCEIREFLERYVHICVKKGIMELTIQFIVDLFSIPSSIAFRQFSLPTVEVIQKAIGEDKFLLILLEICARPSIDPMVTQRTLKCTEKALLGAKFQIDKEIIQCALVTALALVVHSELNVREGALKIFNKLESTTSKEDSSEGIGYLCSLVCKESSSFRASLILDGTNTLPRLLQKTIQGIDNASNIRNVLLESCVNSIVTMKHLGLLTPFASGSCRSATLVLNAMESAGESSFPLHDRWNTAGKALFDLFLHNNDAPITSAIQELVGCIVVMLKGVTVVGNDMDNHVMITTGPSGLGRRHRSYSFGKSDGLSYIEHYPISMVKSIKDCLSNSSSGKKGQLSMELCECVNQLVLGRSSWLNGIFSRLDSDTRKCIASSLLKLRTQSSIESAGTAFSGLGLDASEICDILSSIKHTSCNDSSNLFALSLLADFVRGRAKKLGDDSNILGLSSSLFKWVSQLSIDGNDESEYTRSCLLHALCSLHDQNNISYIKTACTNKSQKTKKYTKQVGEHAKHIVSLLGAGDDGITPLQSSKSRLICMTLLANLCSTFPVTVVHCLLPTLAHVMSSLSSSTPILSNAQLVRKTKAAEDSLKVIIPAYCKHAPVAGLTLLDLLSAFLGKHDFGKNADYNVHVQLIGHLIDSLVSSLKSNDTGVAIASVVAYFTAQMSSSCISVTPLSKASFPSNDHIIAFCAKILTQVDVSHQIVVALQILQYIINLISLLGNDVPLEKPSNKKHDVFLTFSTRDLSSLATRGKIFDEGNANSSFNETDKNSLMWLIRTLLEIVRSNILSAPTIKQAIRNCGDKQAEICLGIWQSLMEIQSNSSQLQHEDRSLSNTQNVRYRAFCESIELETSSSVALIQKLLPVPHFLASVSSIINDADSDLDLQRKAVSLLAERSIEIDAMSPEGELFLDVVPGLVKLISKKTSKNNDHNDRRLNLLREASCRALDQLGRSLGLVDNEKIVRQRATVFIPAFREMTLFLHSLSHSAGDILQSSFEQFQTLSSLSLCLSTLVIFLKARCLPDLPKLVKSLISLLSLVNLHAQTTSGTKTESNHVTKLIQVSLLRALVAVVETLPQFMVSYIKPLLTPSGLLSTTLRAHGTEDNLAVKTMTERLDTALATLTPSRQLIPILCTAINEYFNIAKGVDSCNEGTTVFSILKAAISASSRPDLGPVAGKIVNALIQAYGYDCDKETNANLLEIANATLIALVMKLSEVQLRRLYAKFHQWSTTPDTSTGKVSTLRRHSFYSLSAAMSKELRSIFLPCVSTIIGDIAKELENAALGMGAILKETERNKRRRLNTSSIEYDYREVRPLQPLLLLLETALKADAHEGGTWVRSDDNSRYRMLVSPLGKLLQGFVPRESITVLDFDRLEESKDASPYERVVQGIGTREYGNVISCITSLATAAGNEQLWKPLNHLLLEACRNEGRPEVRKSGVKALLSIIEALGEEYMVLLPECLPVLSELLEDAEDEEIVVLARECIRQGEELLGESLEDSLR